MIIFKKLRWMNLLSTGNAFTEISLDTHKQTLIIGDNGSGKSTVLDALSFALYGKPFRKVNKGQLINSINNKGLLVECEFQIGKKLYLVRRGSKPNVFEVFQDGTLINLNAAIADYQDMLDRHILKINHKSFSQIVVLGSASFVPFMQLTAAHRREVIEDLLDIQVFTTMNVLLKDKVSKNKNDILDTDYNSSRTQSLIEVEKNHLNQLKTNNAELISQKNTQIDGYIKQIDDANASIRQIYEEVQQHSASISDQTKTQTRLEKVKEISRQVDTKRQKIQSDSKFFQTHSDCPTCRQGIDHEHKAEILEKAESQLTEIQQGSEKITNELTRLNNRLAEIAAVVSTIAEKTREASNLQIKVQTWESFVSSIKSEVDKLSATTQFEDNRDRLNTLSDSLKTLEQQKETLVNQKVVLDAANVLLKDSGIKTRIIRQYVPVINKLINKYLANMDFFVNFELNENFEETIKSRFRDEFSYASFSEGEKSRIDLALLFTWRAVSKLRNSVSTNLLILDEVFDGSLDSQGNEELLKIIQTLTDGNNVFVISHKTDAYLDKFERVLKFEKQKNFSKMIEL